MVLVRVPLLYELRASGVELSVDEIGALVASFNVRPVLMDKVVKLSMLILPLFG